MKYKQLPHDFLRPYQMGSPLTGGGVWEIRRNIARGDQVICFQGPTAMGKTRIFSYITHGAATKGNVVWILVHRRELLRQASASMDEMNISHGLISPQYTPSPFEMVQIASVDTLARRYQKMPVPKIIIADEFHHCVSPTWSKLLSFYISRGTVVLGFTATPNRLDGRGLGKTCGGICDSLVLGPQPQELIDGGYLARPRIFCPTLATPEGLHSQFGEFRSDEVDSMMDKPKIIGDAVQSYSTHCPNVPTISFVRSLKMAEHVVNHYRAAGYQAAMVDGKMDDKERNGRIAALGNGGLHVLVSCQLIDEGVDVPVVEGIQLLDPTKSLARFLQRTGRGARMFPGKKGYYLLDHVCNTFYPNMKPNHGDPSWDREWSLDGEVKRKKSKDDDEPSLNVKQCPSCYAVHMPAPRCPFCGHEYKPEGRQIEEVDGELHEIDQKLHAERLAKAEELKAKQFRGREEGRCQTLDDWERLGQARGYAGWRKWARIRYEQRQGRRRPESQGGLLL